MRNTPLLETTPQGEAADALVVKWLMENQKAAGVFATVSTLVDRVSDNPAARIAAQEIAERLQLAAQALAIPAAPPSASSNPRPRLPLRIEPQSLGDEADSVESRQWNHRPP